MYRTAKAGSGTMYCENENPSGREAAVRPASICRKDGPCPFRGSIAVGSSNNFAAERRIHMAYVPVPKDLTRVKTKFLFNLTKRQVFCFGLGALVGVPLFFVTKDTMGSSMAALIMIAAMMPFFMFAIYEQHGQPLEVLLQHYIQARFVRPRTRVYQTENFYATIDQNIRTRREVKKILHGKSPH